MERCNTTGDLRPRVLVFDTFARTGGGLSYIVNIAEALACDTSRFRYIFCLNPAVRGMVDGLEKVAEVRFADEGFSRGGMRGFFKRRTMLCRIVEEIAPDILLCMNQAELRFPKLPSVLFLQNALYFIPFVEARRMGFSLKQYLRCRFLRSQTLKSIRNTDLVMTSTAGFRDLIFRDVGMCRRPWRVVPFGNNTQVIDTRERDYSRCRRLLCLQFNFYKGLDVALRALQLLVARGFDLELTITDSLQNSSAPEARRTWRMIGELGLTERVRCIGKIDQADMHTVYADHDIFVFPSYIESFGFGQLEAMSNGIPCVVSDIPVNRELCADVALYVPAGDHRALAQEIERLVQNEAMRRVRGAMGRQRARDFSWGHHLELLETAIQEAFFNTPEKK